ncbi:TetR/AcrR family transcriptional regulator [Streptomyces sp. NPDC005728]|uniref:TetR/AcrR family transcriptional regulator n=1 Tax=Streptomyces sp. NPDC005728 TaxID=3157054 RepID=UPI0033DF46D7
MSGTPERPLRADAARIARAAGGGVGTLFRHFPTKEALLEAVMVRRLEAMAAQTARLAAEAGPADAFFACLRLVVEESVGRNEFTQALSAAGRDVHASLQGPTMEIQGRLAELLAGAQQAGAVRPELGLPEFIALLAGTSRAMEQLGADPTPRERIFDVVFDGLRPR